MLLQVSTYSIFWSLVRIDGMFQEDKRFSDWNWCVICHFTRVRWSQQINLQTRQWAYSEPCKILKLPVFNQGLWTLDSIFMCTMQYAFNFKVTDLLSYEGTPTTMVRIIIQHLTQRTYLPFNSIIINYFWFKSKKLQWYTLHKFSKGTDSFWVPCISFSRQNFPQPTC